MDTVAKRNWSPRNIRKDGSLRRSRSYSSEDEESIDLRADLASPFNEPNVAFVFEERKLYVEREQLIAVSPVFEAMFSSKFKEGSKKEISLPGKNINHFVRFLRYLCPGFDDELTEDTVHLMLPLANEYQTDDLKNRIERFLVSSVLCELEFISSEQIILNILEAELYKLSNYLDACIQVASRKMFDNLTKSLKFEEIS
ncbi:uncharacterized protein LOC134694406 [Mytilus trossulus]|uniref:uncharacterized protein LOC134694406 n=1 Tax=Mytilus trossulus TaxID=6551 RepID=UPI0030040821